MVDSLQIQIETNLPIPMRDGIVLYADLYRPNEEGPFPTIIQRTPYDKSSALSNQMLDPI